jgi:DNA-binding transcriptional MerR regulator
MTVAEAAAEAGVSAHTLRYYERAGLLARVDRNGAGHRDFTDEDIEWVVMVTRLRATGMPIRKVREYADLVREGGGNEAARLAVLEAHRREVLAHLEQTRRNLEAIDRKISYYRETVNALTPVSSAETSHSRAASSGSTA